MVTPTNIVDLVAGKMDKVLEAVGMSECSGEIDTYLTSAQSAIAENLAKEIRNAAKSARWESLTVDALTELLERSVRSLDPLTMELKKALLEAYKEALEASSAKARTDLLYLAPGVERACIGSFRSAADEGPASYLKFLYSFAGEADPRTNDPNLDAREAAFSECREQAVSQLHFRLGLPSACSGKDFHREFAQFENVLHQVLLDMIDRKAGIAGVDEDGVERLYDELAEIIASKENAIIAGIADMKWLEPACSEAIARLLAGEDSDSDDADMTVAE